MSLIPTWPFVAGALVIGLATGAAVDHRFMSARIDKLRADTAEVDRQRAEIRAADERDARIKEQSWSTKVGQIQQEKTDAIAKAQAAGAAALNSERMRQRADRRPTAGGEVSGAATSCQGATGLELSRTDAGFLIGEATRGDVLRESLDACYKAYDALSHRDTGN